MSFFKWSRTAASDATADPSINWAEGMAPSGINDSGRAMMAATAKYRDDIAGAIVTGGTSAAYTVSSYQSFDTLAHLDGQMIAFTPHTTCGAIVTLNLDGLGAKPLRSAPSVEIPAGTLIEGTPYLALYNNSDAAFYLQNFFGDPYNIPIGASVDYWGTSAPNSSFALMYGQAISRTTYSALFALLSTTFGTGDGSTTFNIPDLRGRVVAGKDDMGGSAASRLSGTSIGTGGPTTLGGTGGSDTKTILTANLPPYTPTGALTVTSTDAKIPSNASVYNGFGGGGSNNGVTGPGGPGGAPTIGAITSTGSLAGVAQGGSSTPFSLAQPTIIGNKLLRLI